MRWKVLLLIPILNLLSFSNSMAGQIRWSIGGNFIFSSIKLTDFSDTTTTLSSLQSFNGTSAVDLKLGFGNSPNYLVFGAYGIYQLTTYDVSLFPNISSSAFASLGYGGELGIKLGPIKLFGFAQVQELYILTQTDDFNLTKTEVTEFGGRMDLNLIHRFNLDILLKGKYAVIPAKNDVISGSELGGGLYLEVGPSNRWVFGESIVRRTYSTAGGTITTQDLQFSINFVLYLSGSRGSKKGF
ncbi:MAG: hypothetical protein ABIQ95_07500 [Bdellovibrionia bacterium]